MPVRLKLALGIKEQRAKASPGQPADAFYLTHIQLVFDDSCVVCHGSRKKKGGLNMESYADLLKGGENGPVVAVASGASPNKTLADLKREGIEVAAVAVAAPPVAPDHRKFAAQIAALEAKLHVRLVPVSQTVTAGLILRPVNEPGKIDDAPLAQLSPAALRGIGSLREVYGFGSKMSARTARGVASGPQPAAHRQMQAPDERVRRAGLARYKSSHPARRGP